MVRPFAHRKGSRAVSERNECPHLAEVQQLWEGELGELQTGEVRRHLAHCSDCRAEYESWDHLSGLLARGDPAASSTLERRQQLKQQLLARVPRVPAAPPVRAAGPRADAASLPAAGNPERPERRDGPRVGARRGLRPIWMLRALAPVAAVLLLLLVFGRHVPPGTRRFTGELTRIGSAQPPLPPEVPPRKAVASPIGRVPGPPFAARRRSEKPVSASRPKGVAEQSPGPGPGKAAQQNLPAPRRGGRNLVDTPWSRYNGWPPVTSPAARSRRRLRLAQAANVLPERPRRHGFHPFTASRPSEERVVAAPENHPAAPPPIERIVIQADAPPPVAARSITQVTIRAVGDPQAPDAQLAVVRSRREEALP
jgi:hypothetical protein